jgi:hypothetical protein
MLAAVALFVHGIVPWSLQNTGSKRVTSLASDMMARRDRRTPYVDKMRE